MSREVFSPFISSRIERPLAWVNRREVIEMWGQEVVKINCEHPVYCEIDEHHHDTEADAIRDMIEQLEQQQSAVVECYQKEITRWQEKLSAIETEVTA